MLCSDGLTNELTDTEIAEQLGLGQDPSTSAKALVGLANERGGRDNSTVLIVDVQVEVIESEEANLSSETTDSPTSVITPPHEPNPSKDRSKDLSDRTEQTSNIKERSWLYDRVHIKLSAVVIALVLLLTSAAMVTTIGWYARSSYHVGVVANHVVIQKGRIGGLLWFEPTLEHWTDIQTVQLTEQDRQRLVNGEQMSDLDDAKLFVSNLRSRLIKGADGN
tara:strand:- start:826 stop:1488 length:663 start_codon:yes stop_codon:yes gene_type:complete